MHCVLRLMTMTEDWWSHRSLVRRLPSTHLYAITWQVIHNHRVYVCRAIGCTLCVCVFSFSLLLSFLVCISDKMHACNSTVECVFEFSMDRCAFENWKPNWHNDTTRQNIIIHNNSSIISSISACEWINFLNNPLHRANMVHTIRSRLSIVCCAFHSHHNSNHIFQRVRCVRSPSIWLLIFRWHFTAYTFYTSSMYGGKLCKHLNWLPQSRFECILHIAQHTHILTRREDERTHFFSSQKMKMKRTKPLNCCA